MAFTHSDLYAEVKELVRVEVAAGRIVKAAWIVPLMAKKHPAPRTWRGDHADAWRVSYREHVKDLARLCVREFKQKEEELDPQQPSLPGFKRLQRSYQIDRNGEPMVVPLIQMNDDEIEEKATELDRLAAGNTAHAAELRRYLRDRKAAA